MNFDVKELYIYPIKSLAGIRVENAKAEEMGFENDRRWMLIGEENQFITQRKYPNLSQFYRKIAAGKITILHENKSHEFFIDESFSKSWFSITLNKFGKALSPIPLIT